MIPIKTLEEIKIMKEGGKILAEIMKELEKKVKPGIKTLELDRAAEALILNSGGKSSFKGYQNFPAALCVSVNEEIVHCIPSERILKEGDIISLDLGIFYKGYHSDMALTLAVGEIAKRAKDLIETTKTALKIGIQEIKAGKFFGDIGYVIQKHVEKNGFNVIRDLCGHGIGKELHEDPQILNYGKIKTEFEIKEGMVFCLEPMVVAGSWQIENAKDGYGYKTQDNSLSAHFEHTIAVTKNGYEVLTTF